MSFDDLQQINIYANARTSLIYVDTFEETRFLDELFKQQHEQGQYERTIFVWSCTQGWYKLSFDYNRIIETVVDADCTDPHSALEFVYKNEDDGIPKFSLFVFKDFHPYVDDPITVRKIRDVVKMIKNTYKTMVMLSPIRKVPEELSKDAVIVDYSLPTYQELTDLMNRFISSFEKREDVVVELTDDDKETLIKSAQGLTYNEAMAALSKSVASTAKVNRESIRTLLEEKNQIIKKSELLDFYPVDSSFEKVGGLNVLKQWFQDRVHHFSDEAKDFGLPDPKGIMLLGVPGCGKSLCAKAIGALWQLPVLQFDVGRVFSGIVGSSESNIRQVIKIAEGLAPCVLFIDEMEKGFSGMQSSTYSDSGTAARTFGTFLQWMQDKKKPVFVLGTANSIHSLPPEFLRKGRFDEIFYIDLPTGEERREIFNIHLQRIKRDPALVSDEIIAATKQFSGAEIEQVVNDALSDSFIDGRRELKTSDLLNQSKNKVPLAKTMNEPIQALRKWASERARLATDIQLKEENGTWLAEEQFLKIRPTNKSNMRRPINPNLN